MTPSEKLEMLSDEEKAEIIDHMNSDHADAVLTYVHFFGNERMPCRRVLRLSPRKRCISV